MAYSRLKKKIPFLALALVVSIVVAVMMPPPCAAQDSAQDYLDLHNEARAAVGVGAVTWDDTVAAYAANYAAQRQGICAHEHSQGGPYGENLYWGSAASASAAVGYWVAEGDYYDYDSNSCTSGRECRHYTQVVWSGTTSIGCASVACSSSDVVVICSYDPAGNVRGQRPY